MKAAFSRANGHSVSTPDAPTATFEADLLSPWKETLSDCRRSIALASVGDRPEAFRVAAERMAPLVYLRLVAKQDVVDTLYDIAISTNLVEIFGDDRVTTVLGNSLSCGPDVLARAAGSNSALDVRVVDLDHEALLVELAGLGQAEYAKRRVAAAVELNIPIRFLDAEIKQRRLAKTIPKDDLPFDDWRIEPWHVPVGLADILEDITLLLRRYLVLPLHAPEAIALWIMHAWTHGAATISPLLAITSPEKRCAKTTLLNTLRFLTPRPLPTANVTPAALFRAVERWRPTLLIDEADTFLGENAELRGVLNSGHCRSSAIVIRTVGDDHEPRAFSTWAPKAIALIGKLHPTLADRAIIIAMRRKRRTEMVSRFPGLDCAAFIELRRKLARWVGSSDLSEADPDIPDVLHDRAADNWRPLLAIADAAGGHWPMVARAASVVFSGGEDIDENSTRVRLLSDIRFAFAELDSDRSSSQALIGELVRDPTGPWAEFRHGKPITARQLADMLRPFGIIPTNVRDGEQVFKGYLYASFEDAFSRYLPDRAAHTGQDPLRRYNSDGIGTSAGFASATEHKV